MTLSAALLTLLVLLGGVYAVAVLQGIFAFGVRRWPAALVTPLARAATLLSRQPGIPQGADRLLFTSAPLVALATVAVAALVVPLSPTLHAFDPSIGLFYFLVCVGPFAVALMNAGWGANGTLGLFGTFRAAAHLLSYEVPFGFSANGPAMDAESLSTVRVVEAQAGLWFIVWQPLGFAIYVIAALMMSFRRPFDLPQAGSELAGGVLAEYSGGRLLLFRVALDALFVLFAAMGTILFLGGWHGPMLPAPVWFVVKTVVLAAALLALGRAVPRLRHDQMLAFAWKVLLPASLMNVAIVGIAMLLRDWT